MARRATTARRDRAPEPSPVPAVPLALLLRRPQEKSGFLHCARVNYRSASMTLETSSLSACADPASTLTAFAGFHRIARGSRAELVAALRARTDDTPYLVFDDQSGAQIDLDLREPPAPAGEPPRGVGRPKLGVVAREVTLLPRQWEWLGRQPGGASVALRRLIDEARRVNAGRDAARAAREATYGVMTVLAGNLPGFEEAMRALFALERERFEQHISTWPEDLRAHLQELSGASWTHE